MKALSGMYWYVEQLFNKLYEGDPLPFTLTKDFYGLGQDQVALEQSNIYREVTEVLADVRDNPGKYIRRTMGGDEVLVIPTNKFQITLDIPALVEKGVIPAEMADKVDPVIRWEIKKQVLYRHELMLLDIVGTNKFMRDINIGYPKQSGIDKIFPHIMEYSIMDGLNYKLVPYRSDRVFTCSECGIMYRQNYACPQCGKTKSDWRLFSETSADYFLNGADGKPLLWGSLDKDIYIDPVSREQFVPRIYQSMVILAREENERGNKDKAQALLELYHKNYPYSNFRPENIPAQYVEIYYAIYGNEKIDKVKEIWSWMFDYNSALAKYCASFPEEKKDAVESELYQALQNLAFLHKCASEKLNDETLAKKAEEVLQRYTPSNLLAQ